MMKPCERCKTPFVTERPTRARFCSDTCRKAAKRAQQAAGELDRVEKGEPRTVQTPAGAPLVVGDGLAAEVASYLAAVPDGPTKSEAVLIAGRLEALDDSAAGIASLSRRLGELLASLVAPAPPAVVAESVKAAVRDVEALAAGGTLFGDMALASIADDDEWLERWETREAIDYDPATGERRWPNDGHPPVWLTPIRLRLPRGAVDGDSAAERIREAITAGHLPTPVGF